MRWPLAARLARSGNEADTLRRGALRAQRITRTWV